MSDESASGVVIGCLIALVAIIVLQPMWFALLFGILSSISAPTWMWALYWAYVPTAAVIAILGAIMKAMTS